jgi:AP endonuclease-1
MSSNPSPLTADETQPAVTKAVNGKKRKAETAVNTIKVTKRKTTVQAETDASINGSASDKPVEAAKPKKRAPKAKVRKETVENEVVVQEGEKDTIVKEKQTVSRKKKDVTVSSSAFNCGRFAC